MMVESITNSKLTMCSRDRMDNVWISNLRARLSGVAQFKNRFRRYHVNEYGQLEQVCPRVGELGAVDKVVVDAKPLDAVLEDDDAHDDHDEAA